MPSTARRRRTSSGNPSRTAACGWATTTSPGSTRWRTSAMRSSSTDPPSHPEPPPLDSVRGRLRRRGISSDWEEFARREPYFAVLTEARFLRERVDLDEFYATGEADIARLFADIVRYLGAPFAPRSALDFGCGVGRLTLALTRRVPEVVGCDASETMLRLAQSAVPNATFTTELPRRAFDFVCSLIVFQHIPVSEGMPLV